MSTSDGSTEPLDVQIGGDHYKSMAIQPMEYSMANKLDACQHTIIKYVTRFREKGGIQDLEKAKHCIDLLIHFERQSAALSFVDEAREFIDPADVEIASLDDGIFRRQATEQHRPSQIFTGARCMVCGHKPGHGGLQCPTLTPMANLEPASAIDDSSERMQAIGQNGEMASEVYAAVDGWVLWNGGECPVMDGTLIDTRHRDGELWLGSVCGQYGTRTAPMFWTHTGDKAEVIAYRLHAK